MTAATSIPASGRTMGMAVTLAAALALGFNNVTLPHVYAAGWNSQSVVLGRFVFTTIVVFLALLVTGRSMLLSGRETGHAIGSGAAIAAGAVGLLGSFQYIPVSLAIVIVYTYPVLTAVMLSLWHRRLPSPLQLACLVIAFAGVAVATGINDITLDPRGLALAALGAFGFSLSFAWNSVALRSADTMAVTLYMVITGAIMMAVYLGATGTLQTPSAGLGWLLFLIPAGCFAFAMLGMYEGVKRIGGGPAAMLMNLEPVFTVALAPFMLGEHLTALHIIGGLLVIGAVYLSERAGSSA